MSGCLGALRSADAGARGRAEAVLRRAEREAPGLLAEELCAVAAAEGAAPAVRQLACVLLKNFVRAHWRRDAPRFEPPLLGAAAKLRVKRTVTQLHRGLGVAARVAVGRRGPHRVPAPRGPRVGPRRPPRARRAPRRARGPRARGLRARRRRAPPRAPPPRRLARPLRRRDARPRHRRLCRLRRLARPARGRTPARRHIFSLWPPRPQLVARFRCNSRSFSINRFIIVVSTTISTPTATTTASTAATTTESTTTT